MTVSKVTARDIGGEGLRVDDRVHVVRPAEYARRPGYVEAIESQDYIAIVFTDVPTFEGLITDSANVRKVTRFTIPGEGEA